MITSFRGLSKAPPQQQPPEYLSNALDELQLAPMDKVPLLAFLLSILLQQYAKRAIGSIT
jgi:hypothetical protein